MGQKIEIPSEMLKTHLQTNMHIYKLELYVSSNIPIAQHIQDCYSPSENRSYNR